MDDSGDDCEPDYSKLHCNYCDRPVTQVPAHMLLVERDFLPRSQKDAETGKLLLLQCHTAKRQDVLVMERFCNFHDGDVYWPCSPAPIVYDDFFALWFRIRDENILTRVANLMRSPLESARFRELRKIKEQLNSAGVYTLAPASEYRYRFQDIGRSVAKLPLCIFMLISSM
jgi:hypothetical protein